MLAKQNGAVTLVALGAWVACAVGAPAFAASPERRRSWLLAFVLGALAPPAAVVVRYAAAGELGALWFWAVDYNKTIYMAPFSAGEIGRIWRAWMSHFAMPLMLTCGLAAWGLMRPYLARGPRGYARAVAADGFTPAVALGTLLGVAVCNGALRGFPHYYVQVVPWAGLLFGLLVEDVLARTEPRRAAMTRALMAAPAVILMFLAWDWNVRQHHHSNKAMRDWAAHVCALVDEQVGPDERLFVWGFRPDLYTFCRRRPASKYLFTTFVAGFVPWFVQMPLAEEDRLAVPGARDELLADLERWQVPLILDDPTSMGNRSMTRYPALAAYLDGHYCFGGVRSNLYVYVRKERQGSPTCGAIPRPNR